VQAFWDIAWDKDGSLITAASYFPLVTPAVFGSKPVTSYGSADMLVAKIDPSSGNASWSSPRAMTRTRTSPALRSAVLARRDRHLYGKPGRLQWNQPSKVIVNSGTTPVDSLRDERHRRQWALGQKVNLGNGGLSAIAASQERFSRRVRFRNEQRRKPCRNGNHHRPWNAGWRRGRGGGGHKGQRWQRPLVAPVWRCTGPDVHLGCA